MEIAAVSTIIGVLTGMHHYYNWTHKMSAWNSVIFAFFTTVTVALSIIFAPVIASAMSGIILSGGVLLEISALIMIPLAINYGGTLLEAVDIIFDSKKSVMERISAIGYLVAQLVTFWSASKASKGISKSATKSTGAPKSGLPKGIDYDGTVHRAVNPKYADGAWDIHTGNIGATHRYSSRGRGALYSGTSKKAVLGELAHYKIDPSKVSFLSRKVKVNNVLDLTNPSVRKQLGISLKDITGDSYHMTHGLGDYARGRYNGILVPSARKAGASHLITF